jgi:hypothetical protein
MRRFVLAMFMFGALAAFGPAGVMAARNPSPEGTGPPSQNCVEIEEAGGHVPGKSSSSPGSPFNEEGFEGQAGGTGGAHYNAERSQYDVACFQVSHH